MTIKGCKDCVFFDSSYCRRYPPQVVFQGAATGTETKWPAPLPEDICGEFRVGPAPWNATMHWEVGR